MNWLPILALAVAAFAFAVFALRLPRAAHTLFAAALLFGLAGYAIQGSPGLPSAPRPPHAQDAGTGEMLVEARREFFGKEGLPSRFVVTADAFARRGDYENAARFLDNAVRENPGDAEAWTALGNALVEHAEGQLTDAALYAYARAEELAPDNPAAGYFVGLGYLRSGDPQRARAIWAELLDKAPGDADWRPMMEDRVAKLDALISQGFGQ